MKLYGFYYPKIPTVRILYIHLQCVAFKYLDGPTRGGVYKDGLVIGVLQIFFCPRRVFLKITKIYRPSKKVPSG